MNTTSKISWRGLQLLSAVFLISVSSFAWAANESRGVSTDAIAPQFASSSYMLQFAVGMTIVIATICVLGWFLRRILGSSTSGTGVMKMLAGISVGTRERVVLLQIGNRQMLVGVAPGSVAAIHVFDEPIINHDCSDMPDKVASPFSRILGNLGISGGKQ